MANRGLARPASRKPKQLQYIASRRAAGAPATDLAGARVFESPGNGVEFVRNVLESSTEYSMIATDAEGVIMLWNEGLGACTATSPQKRLVATLARMQGLRAFCNGFALAMPASSPSRLQRMIEHGWRS